METIMTELQLIQFINDNQFGVGFGFDLGTGEIWPIEDDGPRRFLEFEDF